MSKIEDALNKAKRNLSRDDTGIKALHGNHAKPSDKKDLVSINAGTRELRHEPSIKEIALMESGEIFDNSKLSDLKIIYSEMTDNKTANTFRDLRTKLIQKNQGKNFIVLVTSCVPDIDSSSTSLNIATAFSFDESKTSLLIDCNLNNPKLDSVLHMDADKGLTDYLENESIQVDTIMHKTGIKRLKIIPAGTARETATEYFTSLRMRELMSGLLARYSDRYIFLDAAPITESADTRILVELCDFVILVVPYGAATAGKVKEAAEAIGKDKLLGVVFNDKPKLPKFRLPKLFKF